MSLASAPWIAATTGIAVSVAALSILRFPLPFSGFAAVASGLCAGLSCAAVLFTMPTRWLFSEEELIAHAFRERHGVSALGADYALRAVQRAHTRAVTLRQVAQSFAPELRQRSGEVADRLDAAARRIFYQPSALRELQPALVRSHLIEDLVHDHAALRNHVDAAGADDAVAAASRSRVADAINALDGALRAVDLESANRILTRIEVTSDVAETLLAPQSHRFDDSVKPERPE